MSLRTYLYWIYWFLITVFAFISIHFFEKGVYIACIYPVLTFVPFFIKKIRSKIVLMSFLEKKYKPFYEKSITDLPTFIPFFNFSNSELTDLNDSFIDNYINNNATLNWLIVLSFLMSALIPISFIVLKWG